MQGHIDIWVCLGLAGLDAVMVLETHDDGLAIKRALGRRVDPQTGRVYHLEFDPPPPKEPGLADRLKVAPAFCLPSHARLDMHMRLCPALCTISLRTSLIKNDIAYLYKAAADSKTAANGVSAV